MLGDRSEGVSMLGERTEGGGRIEAMLKRKSLRERHAKLTPETTVASTDTATASQPHAGLLPVGAPSHGRHSVVRRRQDTPGGSGGVEGAAVTGDAMPPTRLAGDEFIIEGDLAGEGERRPPWTLQACARRECGPEAAAGGNDGDIFKSCKSCSLVKVKCHESVLLEWPSVWPVGGDTRELDRGKGGGAPVHLQTCREAHGTPDTNKATRTSKSPCSSAGLEHRAPGCLGGACWWPVLALMVALLLPAALGLPAVIRIGKCSVM